MALLKIARMGHPVLRAAAGPVDDPTAPWVRRLVEDMVETMEDAGGTGIAAPQVHQPYRLVVFRVPGERLTDMPGDVAQDLTVLINPVVETLGGGRALGWEGCLSVPGLRGVVPRHLRVRYRGTGLEGEVIEREVEGFHARVVQHECDHLDGILYPQRMTDHRLLVFLEELQRHPIDLAAFLAEAEYEMRSPLAESQRAALIEAMLPDVPFDGWSRAALRGAARRIGMPAAEALALFSDGPAELVACFSRWADRGMLDRLESLPLDQLRAHERIALAVNIRLEIVEPWREAVRRALAVLVLPQHAPLALRLLYETVDGIWYAAGDSATDFSFYTKRATLAGIYAATVLYWLEDRSAGFADTRVFLDRRLAEVARIGEARHRLQTALDRLPNPLRLLRPLR